MKTRFYSALAAASVLFTACAGDSDGADWAGTVTDSAGIPIVQNPAQGLWGEGEAWTVEEVLSVGSLDGDVAFQFGQISGVDVDADGNLYIADMRAQEIRVFDAAGAHLRTIGRPGGGPGELGNAVTGVYIVAGEVVVPDLGNVRVSRYHLDGTFIESQQIDLAKGIPTRLDITANGYLVAQYRNLNPSPDAAAPAGDPIVTLALPGQPTDTLAVLPPGTAVQIRDGQARITIFGAEPAWDANVEGRLVTGMSDDWRLYVWGSGGALERIITRPHQPRPLASRDQQSIRDGLREAYRAMGLSGPALETVLSQMEFAAQYPAFFTLALGPSGSVWAQHVRTATDLASADGTFDIQDLGSTTWSVFDAEGRYLGDITFPGKYQPLSAIGDRFYGIARDELDVQSLKVYRVVTR